MHYFRVHPRQWRERLTALRGMGLSTVETYVAWNLHEPRRGKFRFDGIADLERFLELADDVGLEAIVRPGPYICAEWDNGGFPAWLAADRNLRLRCMDERYLAEVDRWFDELVPRIATHQQSRGGNVTMVQVENEYGSYGNDHDYLRYLADGLQARGIDVPLFTSDGPTGFMLEGGTLPDLPATVNFGSDARRAFDTQRTVRARPNEALFCMEFWNGWFDHWGTEHHVRSAADAADTLSEILGCGGSVNIYMAHGGTNFGFFAGANHDGRLQPTVTSYDYDAPIAESGELTDKYWAFREVLAGYTELPPAPTGEPSPRLRPAVFTLDEECAMLDHLTEPATISPYPVTIEDLGYQHGLMLYRTTVRGPRESLPLRIDGLADRAIVLVDGNHLADLDRDQDTEVQLPELGPAGCRIEILVDILGRVNYGPLLGERKGITGGVRHGQQYLFGWECLPIPTDDPERRPWRFDSERPAPDDRTYPAGGAPEAATGSPTGGPVFRRGTLRVDAPADGFLALPGWNRGAVWVNDFCLGRFWNVGPQRTLYLPAPVLRAGANQVVALELHPTDARSIEVRDKPDLGG